MISIRSLSPRFGIRATLLVLAFLALGSASAHAAGTGLTIQPIKISQTLKPSDTVSGQILLTNASDKDVAVDIAIEDFIPTAGTETFQFVGRAPGVTSVRDWITIKTPLHFVFKQGESKQVPYTIAAPANAEPGSHFGVLFFKATNANETSEIKVGTQVGVLVFVTVPGKFEQKGNINDLSVPAFVQKGPVTFSLTFENTGTVHFEPKGTIDISNMFGTKVGSIPIEGYAVLPTGVKVMSFPWNVSGFLLGRYSAHATIMDIDGNVIATKSASFYAFPIWYLVSFVIALIAIFFIIKFVKSKLKISVSLK